MCSGNRRSVTNGIPYPDIYTLMNKPFQPTLLSPFLGILNAGLGRLASAGNVFLENGYNTGGSYNPASVQLSGAAEYIALASIGYYQ